LPRKKRGRRKNHKKAGMEAELRNLELESSGEEEEVDNQKQDQQSSRYWK
jgi:hypothetical protein